MKRKTLLLTIATLSASLFWGTISKAGDLIPRPVNQVLFFGDSLSDTGNIYFLTNQQIPPSPPYYQGRFSNGPIWVDDLAQALGITIVNITSLITQDLQTTARPSINFAVGGATSGDRNIGSSLLPGLTQELELFQELSPNQPRALYALWIGGNDYIGLRQFPASRRRVRRDVFPVIRNIETALVTLAQTNPRTILVANLPDLGKTPFGRTNAPAALTQLSKTHNILLSQVLHQMRYRFPRTQFLLLDINTLFNQVTQNPNLYQLTNVTDACLDQNSGTVCSNQDSYLFWDDVHPTQVGHRIIAQAALNLLQQNSVTLTQNHSADLANRLPISLTLSK